MSAIQDLNQLFSSSVMGFREVLATVVYGKYLNRAYSARTNLYECNPRSLYEKGIKPVLDERGIPCGQSGPLNITKGIRELNELWAAGRRSKDQKTATALLGLVDWLESVPESQLLDLASEIGRRFDLMADAVVLTQISHDPNTSSILLSSACVDLLDNHVWGGAIPQALCGIALENKFNDDSRFAVDGARDSASTTNKTSKKVGDLSVWDEELLIDVYEVTVKKFDSQRIGEAVQSIRSYFAPGFAPEHFTVKVLCRPEDAPSELKKGAVLTLLGELQVQEVLFEFINIREWLTLEIIGFDIEQRINFFDDIQKYLNGVRVPVEIRQAWSSHFSRSMD